MLWFALKMKTCLIVACLYFSCAFSEIPRRKFEYKYSFKGPYLAQSDGTVPFWEYFGNAIASHDSIRLAPSLRNQKGSIWTKSKTAFPSWEIDFSFRVTGRGRIGADGLALWYTVERGSLGTVYGSSDYWNGLGLFFDSYDNDNKLNNPYVVAVFNNGSFTYDHRNDGASQQLAGCQNSFRNKLYPVKVKVEYLDNHLTVRIGNGMTKNQDDLETCFLSPRINLPASGYFGVSAATGGLADDHDAITFEVFSLHSKDHGSLGSEDLHAKKILLQYEDLNTKLEQRRKDYYKENPDAIKDKDFEMDFQWEFRQVINGQSNMFVSIKDLERTTYEILGKQERIMSMLANQVQDNKAGEPGLLRQELNKVLKSQNQLLQSVKDLKAVYQKSNTIVQNSQNKHGKNVSQAKNSAQSAMDEVKKDLKVIKNNINKKNSKQLQCPKTKGNVSNTVFLTFSIIQLVVLIGYFKYKEMREHAKKKYY